MTEPHDWPLERSAKGTLRPWHLTAVGYVVVLFEDPEEAERAERGLRGSGIPQQDLRLYDATESLRIVSRLREESSSLVKAVQAFAADRPARDRFLENARAGGSALWMYAATEERANRLVRLLAGYHYGFLRYFGGDRVEDINADG